MKVAIIGCLHGMFDAMYEEVRAYEIKHGVVIDFIIVCGDCQTIRHADDLRCLAVPAKYRKLGDFHEYYAGKKKIPKLTICVGGNHEASNYLMTLPYGGWLCDNLFYMGYANVIRYKGIRIAGVSGIFNFKNCNRGRFERMPLNDESIKSIYHTRRLDIFRLQLLGSNAVDKDPIDVFVSHDWPARIYDYGNKQQLLRFKPGFRDDVESRHGLGNPMTEPLVQQLKPRRWFAAHLHCRFYAKVEHDHGKNRQTEFLSLNKIENKRNFMEVLEITPSSECDTQDDHLYYDEEWLTILRKTINLENSSRDNVFCPKIHDRAADAYRVTPSDVNVTIDLMNQSGGFQIQNDFSMVDPVVYNRKNGVQVSLDRERMRFYPNPQTERLRQRLSLDGDRAEPACPKSENGEGAQHEPQASTKNEPTDFKEDPDNVKQEPDTSNPTPGINLGPIIKVEPYIKSERVSSSRGDYPSKRRAMDTSRDPVELDEDGCLPFYIETKGD